jgi:hypothetical protein
MVQLDLKKYCILKKQTTQCIMTVLCQGNFKEQIEKLVSWLLYTTTNCSEGKAWVHFVPNQ